MLWQLGPKRDESKKLLNISKEDNACQYVVKMPLNTEGKKPVSKHPRFSVLTPCVLQCKHWHTALKKQQQKILQNILNFCLRVWREPKKMSGIDCQKTWTILTKKFTSKLSLVRSKFLTVTNPTFQKWLADFGIQKELISLHSWSISTIDTTLIPTGDTIRNYTLALDAATWFLWHSDTLTTTKKGLNYNHTMNVSVRTINITPALCLTFEDAKEEVFAHSAVFHVRALCG